MVIHSEGMTLTRSDSDISIERLIPMEENGEVNLEVSRMAIDEGKQKFLYYIWQ